VLLYLAQRPAVLVSKDELLDAIWPDVAVTPDTLTKSIGELRVALGVHEVEVHAVPRMIVDHQRLNRAIAFDEQRRFGRHPVSGYLHTFQYTAGADFASPDRPTLGARRSAARPGARR
jgi:hypothetical protein